MLTDFVPADDGDLDEDKDDEAAEKLKSAVHAFLEKNLNVRKIKGDTILCLKFRLAILKLTQINLKPSECRWIIRLER